MRPRPGATRAATTGRMLTASVLAVGMTLAVAPLVANATVANATVATVSVATVASQKVAVRVECPQPARQESIPAPTGAPWWAARLGRDHVAGLSLGDGQVVAVLDTGVAPVSALRAALRPGSDLLPAGPAAPAEPVAVDPALIARDCDGRGTVMAGLVAARPGPGLGLPGLARGAEILPVRVLASATDEVDPTVLAKGIAAAVAAGASVILVGSAGRDDPTLQAATMAALAAGVPVVAAAGDGDDPSLAFPAAYDGVIGVAATGTADAAAPVNAVGRVSVGAPGTDIVGFGLDGGVVGGQAGTALAAALVAAAVADVRARFPGLTPLQLRNRVTATADRPGSAVPDPLLGWGVVNPVTALTAPLPATTTGAPAAENPQQAASATTTAMAGSEPGNAPVTPALITVRLPPEPADSGWAVVIAAVLLLLAAGAAAIVTGSGLARIRGWKPANGTAPSSSPATSPVNTVNTPEVNGTARPAPLIDDGEVADENSAANTSQALPDSRAGSAHGILR